MIDKQADAIKVIDGMLNSYLDISQLDAGAVTPKIEDVAVTDVLARLGPEFAQQAERKGLTLRIRSCSALIRTDPSLLQEILRNLVGNAIKYTPAGKVLVGCRRHGAELRIEVWDTGLGIAKERLAQIFEEFYQLDNVARDRGKGLGLGLAIVDRLAKLLEHPIEVRSVPGKGSLFAVVVPRGQA